MPAWPESLPRCPIGGSYNFTPSGNVVETPNDVGDVIARRRFTGTTMNETGTMVLTNDEAETLYQFWSVSCAQGALEFIMPSWRDGVLRDYRFSQPPQFNRTATRVFCSLSLRYSL